MVVLAFALLLAANAAPSGKIAGKITVAGLAPKLANLPVTRDLKICGTSKPDEALEVGPGGGVKNVVLWVVDGAPPKKPAKTDKKPKLDQESCAYSPHVLATTLGSTVDIINSDQLLHNVRATLGDGKSFNYAMPLKGHIVPTKMKALGAHKVTCDVHPWMHAWLVVLPTSEYAVSDGEGNFALEGIAPGKHKVKIWHERLGEREDEIEVRAGETVAHDVTLNPR